MKSMNDERSIFVTVLAWIFIVLFGMGAFITLLQNIMFHLMQFGEKIDEAIARAEQSGQISSIHAFMFNNFELFIFMMFLFSFFVLVTSIALLKRKNWARLTFIGVMIFGILWNIAGVVLQSAMMPNMAEIPEENVSDQFLMMFNVVKYGTYFIMAVFTLLQLWIIKKLTSLTIKNEFLIS